MADWAAKRFWKETKIIKTDNGFSISLDDKPLKTPAKASLNVPSKAIAQRIAQEWDAQEDLIDPSNMPTTRGANAAIDKLSLQRTEVIEMLCEYGDSDLLCYRSASSTNSLLFCSKNR